MTARTPGPRSVKSPVWTSVAAPPIQRRSAVDKPCLSQDRHKGVEIAVDVTDRDDSARAVGHRLGSQRRRCSEHQCAQDGDTLQTLAADSCCHVSVPLASVEQIPCQGVMSRRPVL